MLKSALFVAALVATTPVAAQDSQTSPRVEGHFKGGSAGYSQDLSIQKIDGKTYSVSVSVAAQGCKGSMQGIGTISGHTMVIKDQAGNCSLTLMRAGPNVQIDIESCSGYTGPSCDFAGTYMRR